MFWALRQMVAPVRYLRIRQGPGLFKSKATYDWFLPLALTVPTAYLTAKFGSHGMFTDKGILGGFQKLLEIMVPFFIAALAAVATFGRDTLDKPMKGHPAVLKVLRSDGNYVDRILTRRQFVCYLFGYLAFLSLCLFVLILLLRVFGDNLGDFATWISGEYRALLKGATLFLFLFPIWQMLITTLLGIYFVTERLQSMDDPGV